MGKGLGRKSGYIPQASQLRFAGIEPDVDRGGEISLHTPIVREGE